MILIGYKQCSTCNKIEKLLQSKHLDYTYREIDKKNPTPEEIKRWHETSGLDIKKFFNTSGRLYKDLKLRQLNQWQIRRNMICWVRTVCWGAADFIGRRGGLCGKRCEKYVSSR